MSNKTNRLILLISALGVISGCGFADAFEVEGYPGLIMDVAILPANASQNRPNPVAQMFLVSGGGPVAGRTQKFLKAAEQKSGCKAIDNTFVYLGSVAAVAAVELDC